MLGGQCSGKAELWTVRLSSMRICFRGLVSAMRSPLRFRWPNYHRRAKAIEAGSIYPDAITANTTGNCGIYTRQDGAGKHCDDMDLAAKRFWSLDINVPVGKRPRSPDDTRIQRIVPTCGDIGPRRTPVCSHILAAPKASACKI